MSLNKETCSKLLYIVSDLALIRKASQLHRRKFYSTKIKNKNVSPSNLPYFSSF